MRWAAGERAGRYRARRASERADPRIAGDGGQGVFCVCAVVWGSEMKESELEPAFGLLMDGRIWMRGRGSWASGRTFEEL